MNIVVAIRVMPNPGQEIEVAESGVDLARDDLAMIINEWDDQALEEAVLLKEATGATVTAVGLRAEGIEQALKMAVARGADEAVVVDAGEIGPYDTATAATALAAALGDMAPDLVLTGVQTSYDVFGQLAPALAARLGWPHASVVSRVSSGGGKVRVVQEYAGGRASVLELDLPAVLGVQAASSPPRYVSMTRLRQVLMGPPARTVGLTVPAVPARSRIVSLAHPQKSGGATMLNGSTEEIAAAIVAQLRDRGILEG